MLSEEEKKAIEKLKKIKEDTMTANKCGLSNNDFKEEIEVYDTVLNLIGKLQKENKELKKYDYRNIKIDKKDELKSASIPKEHLDLMNLGIALYISIPKLLEDGEETDI